MIATSRAYDNKIRVWATDPLSDPEFKVRVEVDTEIKVSKFCVSGRRIACVSLNLANFCDVWVWSIDGNELIARISLTRSNVCVQLNNSGDRIAVWTKDNKKYQRELLVFDTSGGALIHKITCDTRITCVACCHGAYYVVGHVNDLISVWNAVTGTLEWTGHQTTKKSNTVVRKIVCYSGGNGPRPFSCVSYQSYFKYSDRHGRLILWDACSREKFVEFDRGTIRSLHLIAFGSTDSIIIGAGVVDGYHGDPTVTVWQLEICESTHRLQAVIKSRFSLNPSFLRPWCYNPVINVLICGFKGCSHLRVIDAETGKAVGSIHDSGNTGCVQFLHEAGVILL